MDPTLRSGEYLATLNGLKIRYRIAGRGPVLMVQPPGWGPGSAIYEATFKPLEESFTVVYYDPRGSGGSEHPADPETLNVAQFAADLEALRAHLGLDRFALIGHSHGGLIALWYAIHYSRRVTRLITVASQLVGPIEPVDEGEDVVAMRSTDAAFVRGLRVLQEEAGPAIMGAPTDAAITDVLARMAPVYFKDQRYARGLTDFLAAHEIPARTVRETSIRDGEYPVTDRADEIRVPTLVLAGRYDIICPAWALRSLSRRIPGAKFVSFKQSAHFPWLEESDAFFETVRAFTAPVIARQ